MRKIILLIILGLVMVGVDAHPLPGSMVELTILENCIKGQAGIPMIELGNAVGENRIKNLQDPFFISYFTSHIKSYNKGNVWYTQIDRIITGKGQDSIVGNYEKAVVYFTLIPSNRNDLRKFSFVYDAVIHQVVTHSAIVSIKQDWQNGIYPEDRSIEIGMIKHDFSTGKINSLEVNLNKGSRWEGFKKIFTLGTAHIKEGTDHLLFLLMLLFPSMLSLNGKRWGKAESLRHSLIRLIKIVSAFTIGHSITLLVGTIGWVNLPQQPVEILIAVSILISAIHAIYPLFPGKEIFVASGFGLVHGLAFASILSGLTLESSTLALSILGFNLGIEFMQLLIIGLIIPWLFILSQTSNYILFKNALANFAVVSSIAWLTERITGSSNWIVGAMNAIPENGPSLIGLFAIISVFGYTLDRYTRN